jgi:predicted esterase
MWKVLLDIDLTDPVFLWVWFVLSAAAVIYLLFKKRTVGWFLTAIIVLIVGAMIGASVLWVAVNLFNAFGGPVDESVWVWVPAAFAGILLAIFNLWGSRWWRKLIALVSILVFAVTATVAVNAAYGITPTLGGILHISTATDADLPTPGPTDDADPAEPLYQRWTPPAGMPSTGTTGLVPDGIPNTASGFPARPAQVYLPPAALVDGAPPLPIVIMMMGQPGDPDPQYLAKTLDEYAARNNGLAPIGLVVDQLSDPSTDLLCLDTDRGKVETYIMKDVVPWAREHLNVLQGAKYWTVAGYSNGAQCAASFGAKYPETFGNILAISPEEYPGADDPSVPLDWAFHGDQAAYDAVKPATIMAAKAPYADTTAIFTVGGEDAPYIPGTERLADAATAAGMHVTYYVVPGAGHVLDALEGGLDKGFEVLYPRLGLSAPPTQ